MAVYLILDANGKLFSSPLIIPTGPLPPPPLLTGPAPDPINDIGPCDGPPVLLTGPVPALGLGLVPKPNNPNTCCCDAPVFELGPADPC